MPKIQATVSQLRRAFNRLRLEAQRDIKPHNCLLLFYAAECGLKCALLRDKRLSETGESTATHDFSALMRDLKVSPAAVSAPPSFRLQGKPSSLYDSSYAHQAWRYGVDMESADETALLEWMGKLCKYLETIL